MTSSINVKSGFARHARAVVSVMLIQTLLIIWLSAWAIEDYLNNQYVHTYVDQTIQAYTLVIGAAAFLGIFGSAMGLYLRHRRASATLELVNTGTKVPISTPVARSTRSSAPIAKTGAPSRSTTLTTVTATGTTITGPKPAVELHPAVAALKAELSEARMSLGLASVTASQPAPGPAAQPTRFEDQKPPAPQQILQIAQSQAAPPRPQPQTTGGSIPPTVIRPMGPPGPTGQSQSTGIRLTPSTVIRPMLPTAGSVGPQQGSQVLKVEDRPPMGPARPVGPQPTSQQSASSQPSQVDVSTVITGIVTDPKKKDQNSQNGQSSQHN